MAVELDRRQVLAHASFDELDVWTFGLPDGGLDRPALVFPGETVGEITGDRAALVRGLRRRSGTTTVR
jgi:hypothetical protein